ncbi:MAG: Rieske 2Fe-2S domain-containing protein [Dehalococcoidia bacterium]|nr:Rieske 2Fe-2S domain-containing protein [Dehalococcoidia bacterium]
MARFQPALALDKLVDGWVVGASVDGFLLAFYLVDGQPYCTSDLCTHEASLLSDGGYVEGEEVECPYHGARFNIRTGEVTGPPAIAPLRVFAVEVRDGRVYVAID